MNYLGTDHLIVYAFLLVTLLLGLWAGRGVKDIRDYAIANKMYGTGVLAMTFLATYVGGGFVFGMPGTVFEDGIIAMAAQFLGMLPLLAIALFIAPRMIRFEGSLTMGDVMATLYGKYGQVVTGVLGFFYTVCIVSAQVLSLSYVLEFLLDLKGNWATGLVGLITIFYAARGGMRAVAITDVLQFVVLIIVIPLIANAVFYEIGSVKELFTRLPAEKLQIIGHKKLSYHMTIAFICLFNSTLLNPPFVSRMLMARNKKQAADVFFIGAAFDPLFKLLIMIISLSAFLLHPQIASNKVIPHIINEYFPIGLRGFCIAGLIAVIMSTADSLLHAAGLSFAHDVIKPLRAARGESTNELKWVQYGTFFVGCLALGLVFTSNNVFALLIYGIGIMGASVTIPFVAGVMGLKTDVKSFRVALWITIPTFIAANLFLSKEISHWVTPISLLVNAISFFGAHVIQNGGFVVLKSDIGETMWQPSSARSSRWHPTLQNLLQYSKERVSKYGASPTLFALFVSFNYMVPLFMHSCATPAAYGWIMLIKGLGVLLCTSLLLEPYWPARLLAYFPLCYHFSLMYCLSFVTTFLFLLEGAPKEWLLNVALSVILFITLADWLTFVGLSLLGVVLAMLLYRLGVGPLSVGMDVDTKYTLFYALTFSTLIGLLFARRKEKRFNRISNQNKVLTQSDQENKTGLLKAAAEKIYTLNALQGAGINDLTTLLRELQSIRPIEEDAEQMQNIKTKLVPIAFQLQEIESKAQDHMRLHIGKLSIEQMINQVQERIREKGVEQQIRYKNITSHQELTCDSGCIITLLSKSLIALQAEEVLPTLVLEDTWLHYPLPDVETGYIKKVEALRMVVTTAQNHSSSLPLSYNPDLNSKKTTNKPDTTQKLEQLDNERIIRSHYGYIECTPTTLLYVIPINVTEVRPRDMDNSYMELGKLLVRSDDCFRNDKIDAQSQERKFLEAVGKRSKANSSVIKIALELIKWYHGPVSRHSGEPFYLHPLSVAQIVLDYNQEEATLLGALLHDVVEDTPMILKHIETVFGVEVAKVVDIVTHLQSIPGSLYKIKLSADENLRILERSGNKHAMYVKLADRMHNMRTIKSHSSYTKQKQIAEETLQFFVPLAERLGLQKAAEELKELCMEVFKRE